MKVIRTPGPGAKQLENLLTGLSGDVVGKVGWFESAKYEDGTPVAYVATIQEYGSPQNNIPPRSFMRTTIAEQRGAWNALAQRGAKAMLKGQSLKDVLDIIGQKARGDIQKKIKQITTPALKESTIAARLYRRRQRNARASTVSTKPLIDSGLMLASIQNTVEPKQ